jgi:transposase
VGYTGNLKGFHYKATQRRQVKKDNITYVGLDVHKNSIDVALSDSEKKGEVRHYGTIDGDLGSLEKLIRKLVPRGRELRFVYEAGPCGYEIYRHLSRMLNTFQTPLTHLLQLPKTALKGIRTNALES